MSTSGVPEPNRALSRVTTVISGWMGRSGMRTGSTTCSSSGIGIEDGGYFEYWLDARAYDPDVHRARPRGLRGDRIQLRECVSVPSVAWLPQPAGLACSLSQSRSEGQSLAASGHAHGLPLGRKLREMIEKGRLAENDDIFAYDLAWEPNWRGQKDRRRFDPEWLAWIKANPRIGGEGGGSLARSRAAPRGRDGNQSHRRTDGQGRQMERPWFATIIASSMT